MKFNFRKNNKGIMLAETAAVLGLIIIIISFVFVKYRNINEQKDIERAVNIFETVIYKYSAKSLNNKKSYLIDIDYTKKTITVRDYTGKELFEKINLPEKISYAAPYDRVLAKEMNLNTTVNGNLSKSFSVYICNYSQKAEYRVAFYNFQQSRILRINVYRNINAGDIEYKDILDYHYKDENESREGWRKE